MKIRTIPGFTIVVAVIAACALLAAAGCGGGSQTSQTAENQGASGQEGAGTAAAPPTEAAPPAETTTAPPPAKETHAPSKPAPPKEAPAESPKTPPPPPAPEFTMVRVAQGKNIPITMDMALSSKTSKAGDAFTAKVSSDIGTKAHPATVIPMGSVLGGTVTDVQKAKAMSGGARITMKFDKLTLPSGESYDILASLVRQGENTKKRTAKGVGGGAAAGAILGTILGRNAKGALIGAAAGAAVGTGVVAAMDNKDVEIPAGAELIVELDQPLEVKLAAARNP